MSDSEVVRAAARLREISKRVPRVALVLGSGLAALADTLDDARHVSFADVPGMGSTSVIGHPGRFVAGELGGVPVIVMQGRLHPYEGHAVSTVTLGVRAMLTLGADTLLVTNAAGGLHAGLAGGALMLITDHLNLTGLNCLVGANDAALGPRFPDMSDAYDRELRRHAHDAARALGITLHEGVYAGVLGPSYETPAEVRMLAGFGASAVGMSTVQEVIAARHMAARVIGLSCITNLGAGLSTSPLSHADVERVARDMAASLTSLVERIVMRIAGVA